MDQGLELEAGKFSSLLSAVVSVTKGHLVPLGKVADGASETYSHSPVLEIGALGLGVCAPGPCLTSISK